MVADKVHKSRFVLSCTEKRRGRAFNRLELFFKAVTSSTLVSKAPRIAPGQRLVRAGEVVAPLYVPIDSTGKLTTLIILVDGYHEHFP